MKQEERNVMTISDNGIVTVTNEVRMSIAEIADLFGIYYQWAKKHIRSIEKSGIATGNCSKSTSMEGMKIYPDYYGLEMIIALAFRVESRNAEIFRRWLLKQIGINDLRIQTLVYSKNISLN